MARQAKSASLLELCPLFRSPTPRPTGHAASLATKISSLMRPQMAPEAQGTRHGRCVLPPPHQADLFAIPRPPLGKHAHANPSARAIKTTAAWPAGGTRRCGKRCSNESPPILRRSQRAKGWIRDIFWHEDSGKCGGKCVSQSSALSWQACGISWVWKPC